MLQVITHKSERTLAQLWLETGDLLRHFADVMIPARMA